MAEDFLEFFVDIGARDCHSSKTQSDGYKKVNLNQIHKYLDEATFNRRIPCVDYISTNGLKLYIPS